MQTLKEAAAQHADWLFFHAEHGAVVIAGLYCMKRYMLTATASYLLIAVPLIAVGLARMLLFSSRRWRAKSDSVPRMCHQPKSRASQPLYMHKRPLGSGR